MHSLRQIAAHDCYVAVSMWHHNPTYERIKRAASLALDVLEPERIKKKYAVMWRDEIDMDWSGYLIPPSDGKGIFQKSQGVSDRDIL